MANKIIKLPEVKELTTFSRSTIYRLIRKGKFPQQIKLSERSRGWIQQEILDYLEKRISNREIGG